MPAQELLDYIKKTRSQGFPETDIRAALLGSGWNASDVEEAFVTLKPKPQVAKLMGEPTGALVPATSHLPVPEGFFAKHSKALTTTMAILILLPALAYAGFVGYQKFSSDEPAEEVAGKQQLTAEEQEEENEKARNRDDQRIRDMASLQKNLETFYATHKAYPQNLEALKQDGLMTSAPRDPKSGKPYLYKALGEPPMHYALTFILEQGSGSLSAGLHQVSSDDQGEADIVERQESTVRGQTTAKGTLAITDLSRKPFYPQEEVTLEVTAAAELEKASLVLDNLKLTDSAQPFVFHFTAPRDAGKYAVKIFGFAKDGETYSSATELTVH